MAHKCLETFFFHNDIKVKTPFPAPCTNHGSASSPLPPFSATAPMTRPSLPDPAWPNPPLPWSSAIEVRPSPAALAPCAPMASSAAVPCLHSRRRVEPAPPPLHRAALVAEPVPPPLSSSATASRPHPLTGISHAHVRAGGAVAHRGRRRGAPAAGVRLEEAKPYTATAAPDLEPGIPFDGTHVTLSWFVPFDFTNLSMCASCPSPSSTSSMAPVDRGAYVC